MVMEVFLVRDKNTKLYFPDPKGRAGRGGSHTEPDADEDHARIFRTVRSAKMFIGQWALGKFVASRGISPGHPGNDWEADYYEDINVIPQPHRDKENLEIVVCQIIPKQSQISLNATTSRTKLP